MTNTRNTSLALLTAKLTLGASLALGLTLSPHGVAHATPIDQNNITFAELEPADGQDDVYDQEVITEDDYRWDCTIMGNRLCGPGNSTGVEPGEYDAGGVFVAPWPKDSNGQWLSPITAARSGWGPGEWRDQLMDAYGDSYVWPDQPA